MEALDPPTVVEPFQPATNSRPGPSCGCGDRVFRKAISGKYDSATHSTRTDPRSDSSKLQLSSDILRRSSPPVFSRRSSPTCRILGRTEPRTMEALDPPTVVEPFQSATNSRPGPSCGCGDRVFRNVNSGKYIDVLSPSYPEISDASSHSPSRKPGISSLLPKPGRKLAASTLEAPDPPITVEPLQPATSSRPGPVCGIGEGVFRTGTTGKYGDFLNTSFPESFAVSSQPSSSQPDTTSEQTPVCLPAISTADILDPRNTGLALPVNVSSEGVSVIPSSELHIYYQNVGGMNSCIDQYLLAASDSCYDVIVLTETWLNEHTLSSQVLGPSYEVFRCDRSPLNSRKSSGGGVLIAVRRGLKARAIGDDSWAIIEQTWIALDLTDHTLFLCVVYIPPDRTRDKDLIEMHTKSVLSVMERASLKDKLMVLGDFNLPGIKWRHAADGFFYPDPSESSIVGASTILLDQYSTATLRQVIGITNENGRILDLCFVSTEIPPMLSLAPAPMVKAVNHHPPILLCLNDSSPVPSVTAPASTYYDFRNADYDSIFHILANLDWTLILDCNDVDNATETFSNVLSYLIDRHVPKKVIPASGRVPWHTASLRRFKTKKRAALRAFSKHKTRVLRDRYVRLNHRYKQLARRCFSRYQNNVQSKLKRNPKAFWKHVNEQRKETGLPATITFRDNVATSTPDTCRLFAEKFSSMFTIDAAQRDQIEAACRNVPMSEQAINAIVIDEADIIAAATKLKASNSAGPDGIPSVFLKNCISLLTDPLGRIFRLSLASGRFPTLWKDAYMFPVHKKGDRRNADNYRGISSLCAASKLFELLVLDPIFFHCKNYLSVDQHGFIPKRSTTSNLLQLTSSIMDGFSSGYQTDVIYMDLSAAFDRINHSIAVAKLERLGFCGSLLDWFKSYLSGRSISVKICDELSISFSAHSGIPQGSHLGPLIFLLYFNDINFLLKSHRLSFADDLKIYLQIKTESDVLVLQEDLETIQTWCEINSMILNPKKCTVVTFSRKTTPIYFNYSLLNTSIPRENQVKDLGVILDSKLTYKAHMSYVISKASRNLGFIFRAAKDFRDIHCLKSLYCSLVRSVLEYASPVWNPHFQNGVERIESVQRRFIRYALRRLPWRDPQRLPSYEHRCQLIRMDTLATRREAAKALVVADLLTNRIDCPPLLADIQIQARSRVLRSSSLLRIPHRRTVYAANSGIIALQRAFNRVSSAFDFDISRDTLRRHFLLELR